MSLHAPRLDGGWVALSETVFSIAGRPGHTLHLALDTTMLWNGFRMVVLSVMAHGRAIPLLMT